MTRDRIIEIINKEVAIGDDGMDEEPYLCDVESAADAILAELPQMKWTTEVPTEPGDYKFKTKSGVKCLINIAIDNHGILIAFFNGGQIELEKFVTMWVNSHWCKIPEPEEI